MVKGNSHLLDAYLKKAEEERLSGIACVGSKCIVEEIRREGLKDARNAVVSGRAKGFFRVRTVNRRFSA